MASHAMVLMYAVDVQRASHSQYCVSIVGAVAAGLLAKLGWGHAAAAAAC